MFAKNWAHQHPPKHQIHVHSVSIAHVFNALFQFSVLLLALDVLVVLLAGAVETDADTAQPSAVERIDFVLQQDTVRGKPRAQSQIDGSLDDARQVFVKQRFATVQPRISYAKG